MTLANPATTPIARSKTAALARILDSVPKGYVHYTAGECPAGKLEALARKFHERYGIGCSPAQRLTRKQKGLANALLVLYLPGGTVDDTGASAESGRDSGLEAGWDSGCTAHAAAAAESLPASGARSTLPATEAVPASLQGDTPTHTLLHSEAPGQPIRSPAKVSWVLLATEGKGPVHEQEQLRSVLDSRRLVFLGYELVRYAQRGKTSWTWRRTKPEMADLYALLASQLNARQTNAVAQTLLRISRQPGFSGVRKQSWELCQFARSRGYAGALPHLYYVEKVGQGERLVLSSRTAQGTAG